MLHVNQFNIFRMIGHGGATYVFDLCLLNIIITENMRAQNDRVLYNNTPFSDESDSNYRVYRCGGGIMLSILFSTLSKPTIYKFLLYSHTVTVFARVCLMLMLRGSLLKMCLPKSDVHFSEDFLT